MVLIMDGVELKVSDEGFLLDYRQWNQQIANEIAKLNRIEMTDAHWEIVFFIRDYYQKFKHLPNARMFAKAISHELAVEKGKSRYLHQLFPEGPLKIACKCAGLPKPPTCL